MNNDRTAANAIEHYDLYDELYRKILGDHIHGGLWLREGETLAGAVQESVRHVARRLAIAPGDEVCDVGCGYGGTARILADQYAARVLGVTISKLQHDQAVRMDRGAGNPRYLVCDWMNNGLPSESFDVVLAIESAVHMPDKDRFVSEIYRTLKPGGRVGILCFCTRDSVSQPERIIFVAPALRLAGASSLPSFSEYRDLLKSHGFCHVEAEAHDHSARKTSRSMAAALGRLVLEDRAIRHLIFSMRDSFRMSFNLPIMTLGMHVGSIRYALFLGRKPDKQRA